MSYGYGGRANPYDQRGDNPTPQYSQPGPYGGAQPQQYGRQNYNAPAMGRDEYNGQNVEMEPLTGNGAQYGRQGNPNQILNDCREIDKGIDDIHENLRALKRIQERSLNETNSAANPQLESMSTGIMAQYREFAGKLKAIKQSPESGSPKNAPQVGRVDRKLKQAIEDYRQQDADYRRKLQEQMARQYRIVRPEASDAEVREAVEDTSGAQVFSQALLQSDRRGQSRAALSAVQDRHAAIQKIESQMIELAELFQDMDNLVVQQEEAVQNIEMKGEEVVENMDKGTEQIGVAIQSARNTRKWKWWCLGICVLIVIIIVVVILIYKFVIQTPAKTTNKRFVLPSLASDGTFSLAAAEKIVIPGLEWKGDKLVTSARKMRRFQA